MLNAVYLKVFQLGVVQMGVDWYSSVLKAAFWVLWIISTNKNILWKIKRLFSEHHPCVHHIISSECFTTVAKWPIFFKWRTTTVTRPVNARIISYKQVIHGNWMISVMAVLLTMLNYESLCNISTKECCPITEPYFPQPLYQSPVPRQEFCVVPSQRLEPCLLLPHLLLSSSVQVHIKLFKEICKLQMKRYCYHQR